MDEMVRAVTTWCQLPCTRGLRALAAKGVKLEAASVSPCYQSCIGR